MNGLGMYGTYRRGRRVWPSYDAYKAHRAQMAREQRQRLADAQAERTAAADRRREEAEARAHESKIRQILDCDALWAVNPRADDALEQLDRVPERIRRLCLLLLPPDIDPVYMTIRIRQQTDPKPYTLDMLGRPYGVTRERARQIQESALAVARGCKRLQQMHAELEAHRPTAWEELEWA